MDPLSLAASFTGLLMAGAHISTTLQTLITDSAAAATTAQTITQELHDFGIILSQLQRLILGSAFASHPRASMIDTDKLLMVVTGCVCTFSELEKEVSGLGSWQNMNFWDRRKWTKAGSTLGSLVQRLQNQKLSLNLLLVALTCISPDEAASNVDRLCKVVEDLVTTNMQMAQRLQMLESRLAMSGPSSGDWNTLPNPRENINPATAASIRTITSSRSIISYQSTTAYRLTFEKILFKTRVYRSALRNASQSSASLIGPGIRGSSWSILSGVSLAEVSNISVLSLPLYAAELFSPGWYTAPTLSDTARAPPEQPIRVRQRVWKNAVTAASQRTVADSSEQVHGPLSSQDVEPGASTILHRAAEVGDMEPILSSLSSEVPLEGQNENGFTALQLAAKYGRDDIAQELINRGATIETMGGHWCTTLQLAAEAGHENLVILLLANGAQVDARGGSLNTALHLAAGRGLQSIVRVLLDSGAKVDSRNRVLNTPLHLASRSGHNEVVRMLLENGAQINTQEANGNTPLHIAALYAQKSTVRLLLGDAADLRVINRSGYTPLRLAAKYWDKNGHRLLLNIGVPFIQGHQLEQAEPTFRLLFETVDKDVVGNDLPRLVNSAISYGQTGILRLLQARIAQGTEGCITELNPDQAVSTVKGHETLIVKPIDSLMKDEQVTDQINVIDPEVDHQKPTVQPPNEDSEVPVQPRND